MPLHVLLVGCRRGDIGTGIYYYEFRVDSNSWVKVDDNSIDSYKFTGLDDGDRILQVKAIDYAGNENTADVTVTIDTEDGSSVGESDEAASFRVSDLEVSPSVVHPDGQVEVSCAVRNVGDERGSYTVVLGYEDGTEVGRQSLSIGGGVVRTAEFTLSGFQQGRSYTVVVEDRTASFQVHTISGESVDIGEETRGDASDGGEAVILLGVSVVIAAVSLGIIFYQGRM